MTYEKIRPEGYEKIPFDTMVSLGNFPRYSGTTKFGFNPSVGSSQEDIWSQGGVLSCLASAETQNIVSDDAADKGTPTAGTGARTVMVVGLNNSGEYVSETVTLNGTTNVLTANSYRRVLRMWVATAGSGEINAGNITATASTAGTVQALIPADEGQTQKIQTTVSANKVGVIRSFEVGVGSGTDAVFRLKTREPGSVFRTRRILDTRRQNNQVILFNSLVLPAQTDITITAAVASGNPSVSASIQYWEVDQREMGD